MESAVEAGAGRRLRARVRVRSRCRDEDARAPCRGAGARARRRRYRGLRRDVSRGVEGVDRERVGRPAGEARERE